MTRQALLGENGRTIGNSRAHIFSYDYDLHLIRLPASAIQARLRILPVQLCINRSSKLRNPNPFRSFYSRDESLGIIGPASLRRHQHISF
jgi:hypothetical protein